MRRDAGDHCLKRVTASAARDTSASPPTPQKTRPSDLHEVDRPRCSLGDPPRRGVDPRRHSVLAREIVGAA